MFVTFSVCLLNLIGSRLEYADLESRLPFANSGNPVISLVAFLAASVGPRVAVACAHASLALLSPEVEGSTHGKRINMDGREGGFHGDLNSIRQKGRPWPVLSKRYAAATKAKLFADHEEREIQRLSANIINHQEGVAIEIAEAVIGALRGELAATVVNAPMVPAEAIRQSRVLDEVSHVPPSTRCELVNFFCAF